MMIHLLPDMKVHCSTALLSLLFHLNHIVLRYVFQQSHSFLNHLYDLATNVALDDDLVKALRVLRD